MKFNVWEDERNVMVYESNTIHNKFEALKKAIPVEDLYTELLGPPVRRIGEDGQLLMYHCSFHGTIKPVSLIVSLAELSRGRFECPGCGYFGGMVAFYGFYHKILHKETTRRLAIKYLRLNGGGYGRVA